MKIAVVGSRKITWENERFILSILKKDIGEDKDKIIISGGAKGVDRLAEWYAKENQLAYKIFYPKVYYEPKEYRARNQRIANECDICLAFPSAESRGTWDTINKCIKLGKKVFIYELG